MLSGYSGAQVSWEQGSRHIFCREVREVINGSETDRSQTVIDVAGAWGETHRERRQCEERKTTGHFLRGGQHDWMECDVQGRVMSRLKRW
jgi:hypothetical protein